MKTENRWLLLAIFSVIAMIVLLFAIKIQAAQAKDNNPFSGATSIRIMMHRVRHATRPKIFNPYFMPGKPWAYPWGPVR